LLILLGLGAILSLVRYAPAGDVAEAAQALTAMECPGEAAALTEPLHTEPYQDAYDGHLWVWGVPAKEQVEVEHAGIWTIGAGDPEPAAARFQVGGVRLDYFPPPGEPFDAARLPLPPLRAKLSLGNAVEPVAIQLDDTLVHPGGRLPLAIYWRAQEPMDLSYTVFVQAIGEGGAKAGQIDRLPCSGGCPTTTWRAGDLVGERYDLDILPDAPPGSYRLIGGMYHLATGERLPLVDDQDNAVGDHFPLGSIEVRP
jgi:hypothetical protein